MDFKRLNQFPSVQPNSEAVLVTDEMIDRSVHAIGLKLGGTTFTKAMVEQFNIRVDGKDILPAISGDKLQKMNSYEGLADKAGYVWFFLGDPMAQTIKGQHLGDLDLSIYRFPVEIRVKIGGATAPTLEAVAMTSVPKMQMGVGYDELQAAQLRALRRTVIQPNASISQKAYSLSLGSAPGARLRRSFFHHTNLTSLRYRKNSLDKFDDFTIEENAAFQENYARSPQSGLFVLDSIVDGNQGEAETTVDGNGRIWNQEFALTTSAGDTIEAYTDLHASWPQL